MKTTKTNPTTLAQKKYKNHNRKQVNEKIAASQDCYKDYQHSSMSSRISHLKKVKKNLSQNKNKYARQISREMGKPITQAYSEINKCVELCDYYIQHTKSALSDQQVESYPHKHLITYRPIGVVLIIMPWNFPFWQVFRAAVPALMAGNTVILKHASSVTGISLTLEKIFKLFPKYSFQSIIVSGSHMQNVITQPEIQKVSFTGSTLVGCSIAQLAGGALKPTILELGGNDAYLVLKDADIEDAVHKLMNGRMMNNGQSCIAAKRWLIHEKIYDKFIALAIEKLNTLKIGNPISENTDIGPLISQEAVDEIESTLQHMKKKGQNIIRSQKKKPQKGFFTLPTIVEVVKNPKMYNNLELFGPVALIYRCQNEAEMIDIANDTDFGLGSGVFTRNTKKGTKIAKELLESGSSFVNDYVSSDPALPFGGVKKSGYGRELAQNGLHSFCNIKTVVIK